MPLGVTVSPLEPLLPLSVAEIMTDPEAKRIMVGIAEGYDRLAERAVERTGNRKSDTLQ